MGSKPAMQVATMHETELVTVAAVVGLRYHRTTEYQGELCKM